MTTVFDVPATELIQKLAPKLQEMEELKAPDWAPYVRTGVHRTKAPEQDDWWYTRCAAVLRKVYVQGPVGTERLRGEFGGLRDRGSKPNRTRKGSGSIVRRALQQLEAAGLVESVKGEGRRVAPNGQSLVDNTAYEVSQELSETVPGLAKY